GLDLDFVEPALGEKRADGTVDDTAGENFLFGGTFPALEITAREEDGCSSFCPVVDGQWEEFLIGFGLGGSDCGYDDDGFAQLNRDGTIGLFGQFAGFNSDGLAAYSGDDFFWHVYRVATAGRGELQSTSAGGG